MINLDCPRCNHIIIPISKVVREGELIEISFLCRECRKIWHLENDDLNFMEGKNENSHHNLYSSPFSRRNSDVD